MQALQLDFSLGTPVARAKMPIHLDAALLYAATFGGMPEEEARALLDRAIPQHGAGEEAVYCASAIVFRDVQHFTRFATRRFDLRTFADDISRTVVDARAETKVNLSSGEVRGWLQDVPMMWASKASAWLICNDSEALNILLSRLEYIGKYSRWGCGRVDRVEAVQIDDMSAWQRRVLSFHAPGAAPINATTRPPYWDRSKIRPAYLHGSLVSGEFGVFG